MELNTIRQQGKWSDAASRLNENFYKINAMIATLDRSTRKNKGYFATYNDLTTFVPEGQAGDIAFVGNNYPYKIYRWDGQYWVDTFNSGGDANVDLAKYYTTDEVDNLIEDEQTARETTSKELRELIAQETALRQDADNNANTLIAQIKKELLDNIESEAVRATLSEQSLDEKIGAEVNRAIAVESGLRSGIYANTDRIIAAEKLIAQLQQTLVNDGTIYENSNILPVDTIETIQNGDTAQITLPDTITNYDSKKQGLYFSAWFDIDGDAYEGGDIIVRVRLGNDVYGSVYSLTAQDAAGVPSVMMVFQIPYAEYGSENAIEIQNNTGADITYNEVVLCPYDVNNIRDIVDYHERRITALEKGFVSGGGSGGSGGGTTAEVPVISKAFLDNVFAGIIAPPTTEWA